MQKTLLISPAKPNVVDKIAKKVYTEIDNCSERKKLVEATKGTKSNPEFDRIV